MKKIFLSLFITIFCFTSVFADYIPSEVDKKTVKSLEKTIEKFPTEKINILKEKIPAVLEKLDKNSKNYFLIFEIYKIVNKKEEKNTEDLYEVVQVIDWDSIHFMKWNEKIKARLIGIDAPESTTSRYGYVEEYGKEATEKLKELIGSNKITVEYDENWGKTDKYWRDLIYIFVNWKNINEEMIKSWFAKEYTYKKVYKYQKNFRQAEIEAIKNWLWIWKNKEIPKIENKFKNEKIEKKEETEYRGYHRGRRWGCFYYSWEKEKVYVDHSFCR